MQQQHPCKTQVRLELGEIPSVWIGEATPQAVLGFFDKVLNVSISMLQHIAVFIPGLTIARNRRESRATCMRAMFVRREAIFDGKPRSGPD